MLDVPGKCCTHHVSFARYLCWFAADVLVAEGDGCAMTSIVQDSYNGAGVIVQGSLEDALETLASPEYAVDVETVYVIGGAKVCALFTQLSGFSFSLVGDIGCILQRRRGIPVIFVWFSLIIEYQSRIERFIK